MRVAAYVRMSTELQQFSIANQLRAIRAFCDENGMELERIYSDAGRPGLTYEKRPGLKSLVEDARAGPLPFDAVIVLDVSRWGRFQDLDEGAYYEHLLRRAGAPVIYCGEPFMSEQGGVAEIFKVVKRAMAAEYSRELSVKVSAATRARAANGGWCPARPGYGYRRVKVPSAGSAPSQGGRGFKLAPRPTATLQLGPIEEVQAVRRLFELFLQGDHCLAQIASCLASEGWPAPAGRGWGWELVRNALRNEKYAGVLTFGRTRRYLGQKLQRPDPSTWVRIEGGYPAIISKKTFAAVQARLAHRRPRGKGRKRVIEEHKPSLLDTAPRPRQSS